MRRAECIEWPTCPPPRTVGIRNREDYRHNEPYIYYQARTQLIMSQGHDVLNIDIYDGFALAARYFADAETGTHAALILATGEWTGCVLQNVINACAGLSRDYNEMAAMYGACHAKRWEFASTDDEERVGEYLGQGTGKYGLYTWESNLQRARWIRQLENKKKRINDMLDYLTPEIPEDFYSWMNDVVFKEKYLFQQKDKDRKVTDCSCEACGKTWVQEKAVGAGDRICPKCGEKVRGSYQKTVKQEAKLFLLQPCRDSGKWVERVFFARRTGGPGYQKYVKLYEEIRCIIPKGKNWGECYYCEGTDEDGSPVFRDTNACSYRTKSGYLYPGTLDDCRGLWPKALQNAGLQILAGKMVKANYNYIITTWHVTPWFEYLAKAGFNQLITEMSATVYEQSEKSLRLNNKGKTMQEVFRLSQGRIDRLRQNAGGFKMLNWLQYEETMGQKISAENMTFLMKHFWPDQSDVWKALGYVKSANVFANYVRKQTKMLKMTPAAVVNDWVDYLDMAEKQGLNLSHEIFYKPRNLKEAHDTCVREARLQESQKKAKGILEKFPNVEKNMDAIRDKYTYVGEKFCIRVPDGIPDIIHEGRALGHCIDTTDRYFDRINQNISYLVFLRRRSAPTVPYYTLEIEPGGTIRQQRTTGNNQNKQDVEEYGPFIREWQEEIRKRLTEADRAAAQNSRSVRMEEYRELREKKEKVWHGKLAGALLADVLEADLIENVI